MARKKRLNLPPKREQQKLAIERKFKRKGLSPKTARSRAIAITRAQMKRRP